jgi:hypothetical protein
MQNITKQGKKKVEPAKNITKLAKKGLNWQKSTYIGLNSTETG